MGLLKRTYAIPQETIARFEGVVQPGKRSAVVGALIEEWVETRRLEALRREVIEGCREMAAVYLAIEAEYHPLEEEVMRALDG